MKYNRIFASLAAGMLCCAAIGYAPSASADTKQVIVSDADGLIEALANAEAGQEIILKEGIYQNDKWLGKWAAFYSEASGTPEQHIILRSEDPDHPATICGVTQENKYALNIIGSYWEIRDLKICEAQKGIFLAQSEHSLISGCEVYNIGCEGIHIIDNSSYNLVENCFVHDCGTYKPQYGEGVYIGSAKNTTDYGYECHYNTVRGCKFGPNIAADHVDIKEFTYGNVVEYCTFDGTGMQGENGGDSFVEAKGMDAVIRYNTGYRNGCEKQLYAFDMNVQLDNWGQNTKIYGNTLYLDTADCYVVKGWNCYAEVSNNTVIPAECVSTGNKVMQIEHYYLSGDASEDGLINAEDAQYLQQFLCTGEPPHIFMQNADMNGSDTLNAADLTLLKRKLLNGQTDETPVYSVFYTKEDAGKWRMTDGIGGKTVTFRLQAEPGSTLNMGWGYWDASAVNESTGGTGKWFTIALGKITADGTGSAEITVEMPADTTRMALEVWDYGNDAGNLDKDSVVLKEVLAY
ncbi:MAG: right-handed parallel beta-helix repeat-containing protein [Oscillospiraceae bacterium]|nr:right-handed parallel beta-helix repeat-containing protein [Oscillospiraceae bacterium]